ncbi:MAG: carboxypeptidase regulatory-like domain-containing protein [Pyrinomonadaceae bacterium]
MKLKKKNFRKPLLFFIFVFTLGLLAQSVQASTIAGFVYDKQRNPLPEVDMELLNEYYQLRGRTKTDGAGRYEFQGLADGNYTVRALPFRYDLEDQEWLVEINSFNVRGAGQGNVYQPQDFYLSPRKGGIAEAELGIIFAQTVPEEAKNAYKQAIKDLAEKRNQEGINGLFEAIKIFPEYFDALYRMGKELCFLGKYNEAWQYLLKSTEVNPKYGPAFFYMGYCFHKLGKDYNKVAIRSLTQASILNPGSMRIFFTLGMVERSAGKFEDAEKHLLQAKKLAEKPVAEIQKELVQLYSEDMKKYKEAADELELYMKTGKMSDEEQKSTRALIQRLRDKAKAQPNS